MTCQTSFHLLHRGLLFGTLTALFASAGGSLLLTGAGLLVLTAAIGQALIFCRCPACGHHLKLGAHPAAACPKCGCDLTQ